MKSAGKWRLLAVAVLALLALAALRFVRPRPAAVPAATRRQILEEIAAADASISGVIPDHAGQWLAYLHLTDWPLSDYADTGLLATLVNLQTLEQRPLDRTNNLRFAYGWSPADRYWAFTRNHVAPPPLGQRKRPGDTIDEWLMLYDRQDGSVRRVTAETKVKEQALYWLTDDAYLYARQRMGTNDRARFHRGSLRTGHRAKVADFAEALTILNPETAVFTKNGDLFSLGLKPLDSVAPGATNAVERLSDFHADNLSGLQWVNYSAAHSNFLFCARTAGANWRHLYQYDPAARKVTQLSTEDTYNGQWLLDGAGYAYVINTNNSFQLAIRTFSGRGNTNLFARGNVVVYRASPRGERVYAVASLGCEPHGIWEYTVTNQVLRQVAAGLAKPFAAANVVEPAEFRLKSFDGVEIPCFLYAPRDTNERTSARGGTGLGRVRPKARYPAVIHIPATTSQFQRRFDHQAELFANLGFYYAAINYRGCDGYGAEYSKLAHTGNAARDVLTLYAWLIAHAEVDPGNVFLTTTSGGMAVVSELLAAQPRLWAGVAIDKPGALRVNPRWDTVHLPPLLAISGGQDPLFDPEEARGFFAWAKTNRLDFRSVIHTNSGHITRSLVDRKDVLKQMSDFFSERLR
jgi:dipeptidyl aminopeptidase/acylaminoacyl peptidase